VKHCGGWNPGRRDAETFSGYRIRFIPSMPLQVRLASGETNRAEYSLADI